MEKTTLEVGDKIRISNAFSRYTVEITRVTKTQAITKPTSANPAVQRFKRKLWGDTPQLISRDKWDNTERTLIKQSDHQDVKQQQ